MQLLRNNDSSINFYSKLIMTDQLSFSFLAAMMLAYQPVKSLATINVKVGQGMSQKKNTSIIDIDVKKK